MNNKFNGDQYIMDKKILSAFLIGAGVVGGTVFATNQTVAEAATHKTVTTTKVTSIYNNDGKLVTNRALLHIRLG
ncbi:hypothetical protein [Companilactobacillus nodensis]|uniref:hypothetical protein n=1 Tax=Companilactobacillus nodensis TaxID=460870 RepID=UPI001F33D8DA|nr:hypothetical protein [Companilactobacillus nodensis]